MSSPEFALPPTVAAPVPPIVVSGTGPSGASGGPRPRRRSSRAPATPPPTGTRRADDPLAHAVTIAVGRLAEVDRAGGRVAYAQRGRIETLLRDAVERHRTLGGSLAAVPAVTVACAHLGAGDLENAHLALLTAQDLL